MTITNTGIAIWITLLVITTLIIVPLAVSLLRRTLKAAQNIETYMADMLTAGVGVAKHTSAVPALDSTIKVAVAMKPVVKGIQEKTSVVATLLASRAN